ncbi:MAG: MerR family transcriptional regulator [Coprobacillus sp.]
MKEFYTTGEVAKLCHISIRTVQYYDKYNLVKPSQISEGGRRLYSIDDIRKIEIVILYKEVGFSLDEIRNIIIDKSNSELLREYITKQQESINQEIISLQDKQKKLEVLNEEIQNSDIENLDELKNLTNRYDRHKVIDRRTYNLLFDFVIILLFVFPFFSGFGKLGMIIVIVIIGCFVMGLIWYHSANNAYICPHCQRKFSITFIKDMLSLNNGKKGKILKCPHCGYKGSMKETYVSKH